MKPKNIIIKLKKIRYMFHINFKTMLMVVAMFIIASTRVSKANPIVEWSTYYPNIGTSLYIPYNTVAVNSNDGSVYLAGLDTNNVIGLATPGTHQSVSAGHNDATLAKFSSTGQRIWGTYYGGGDIEVIRDLAINSSDGSVYLSGESWSSTGIASLGAHQSVYAGFGDAFLVKFSSSGQRLWGTYYGGSDEDVGWAVAVNPVSGEVYLAGTTKSNTGIATASAHQIGLVGASGFRDGFLVKFNSSGQRIWGTYYGGAADEWISSLAVDHLDEGSVYLLGFTASTSGISSTTTYQSNHGGTIDTFIVKFNSNGQRIWGTYFGGPGWDLGSTIKINTTDSSINIAGDTASISGIATLEK